MGQEYRASCYIGGYTFSLLNAKYIDKEDSFGTKCFKITIRWFSIIHHIHLYDNLKPVIYAIDNIPAVNGAVLFFSMSSE